MAYETRILPYEVLLRWKNGELSGAHSQSLIQTLEDGKVIAEQVAMPKPVEVDELASVYAEAQAVADSSRLLAENAALQERVAALTVERDALAKVVEGQSK